MPHDLRLLFEAVAVEAPAGLETVAIGREGMAHQHQIPAPARLRLPDMHHLVNEQPLRGAVRAAEVLALKADARMAMQCNNRRHNHPARREEQQLLDRKSNVAGQSEQVLVSLGGASHHKKTNKDKVN